MSPRRATSGFALLVAAMALNGCVAAAIPLAAAGMMARSPAIDRSAKRDAAPAPAAAPSARPETIAAAPGGAETMRVTALTELPPPSGAPQEQVRDDVVRFSIYALQQAQNDPAVTPRLGALLAQPGSLQPVRQQCGSRPPAIVIDLDPGRETFDPLADLTAVAGLGPALLSLRAQGVKVVWQSRLGDHFADAVRDILADTGLDPDGTDRLLLARSVEERQQTLRGDLAESHCIVAMLGDERADFDELFLYLKDPDAALRLEALVDHGWFLTEGLFREVGDEG